MSIIKLMLGRLTLGMLFAFCNRVGVLAATKNIPSSELTALNDFYVATSGDYWVYKEGDGAAWNFTQSDPNPCVELWSGIRCQCLSLSRYCHVVGLNMTRMNQSGTIPSSLTNLPLDTLQIRHSDIFGSLPSNLGDFNTLVSIDVGGNRIAGSLPDSFYDLTLLVNVILANNQFTGSLSSKISQLNKVINLDLSNNRFNGSLPSELSELNLLSLLLVSFNYFTGRLPASWRSLNRLVVLNAQHNFLSGPLPPDYGNMSRLRLFYVWDNLLTGVIPYSYFFIENLTVFDPATNFLHGTLPLNMGYLYHLEIIELSSNMLTGTIPDSLNINSTSVRDFSVDRNMMGGKLPYGFWRKLFTYNTGQNFFTGTIPTQVFDIYEIAIVFSVMQNIISGTIPENMEGLRGLTYFVISDNYISGTIPSTFRNVSLLAQAFLFDNLLTGTIPHPLANLTHLTQFFINNNRLVGTIPTELFSMPSLQLLHMNDNRFTGNLYGIDAVADNVTRYIDESNSTEPHFLVDFDISYNYITGSIPDSLQVYEYLSNAIFTGNCLEGTITRSFCQLPALQFLALDGIGTSQRCRHHLFPSFKSTMSSYLLTKGLDGTVPPCLFSAPRIQSLHLSGNRLTGSLPAYLQITANLSTVVLSHNELTGRIPLSLQSTAFHTLDLSYNRFYGTLDSSFVEPAGDHSVALRVNRLSGIIPQSLVGASNVDILDGNIFNCESNNMASTAPRSDPSFETYNCGSSDIDRSIIAYAIMTGVMLALVCLVRCALPIQEIKFIWQAWYDGYTAMNNVMAFSNVPNVNLCIHWMKNIRLLMTYLVIFILVVLLPVYVVLSMSYSSYDHVYGWRISAVLLAGTVPGWVLFVFYVLMFIGFVLVVYELFFINAEAKRIKQADLSVRSIMFNAHLAMSQKQTMIRDVSADSSSSSLQGVPSSLTSTTIQRASKNVINLSLFIMTCANIFVMTAIDVAYIITFLNSSLVFILFVQIAVALFKIAWNEVALWKILQFAKFYCTFRTCSAIPTAISTEHPTFINVMISDDSNTSCTPGVTKAANDDSSKSAGHSSFATNNSSTCSAGLSTSSSVKNWMRDYTDREVVMMAFNILLNSITVPCIAVALVNSTCYYNAIVPPKRVDDTYETLQCGIILDQFGQNICIFPVQVSHDIGYDPPFTYSYICSSTIDINYTPVYMYMYIFLGLVVPFVKLMLHYLNNKYYEQLGRWLDWVSTDQLRPLQYRKAPDIFVFFQRERLSVRLSTCLGVLMSFGVIYPLLALIAGLSGITMVIIEQVLMGCAYKQIPGDSDSAVYMLYMQMLSSECKNMVTLFMKCIYLIMPFCMGVLAYTIFDTIGYTDGAYAAIVPVCLLFILPFLAVAALYLWYERRQADGNRLPHGSKNNDDSHTSTDIRDTSSDASFIGAMKRSSKRLSSRLSVRGDSNAAAMRTISTIEMMPSVGAASSRVVDDLATEASSDVGASDVASSTRNPMANEIEP